MKMSRSASLISLSGLLVPALAFAGDPRASDPNAEIEGIAVVTDEPVAQWGLASKSFVAFTAWDAQPIGSSTTYDFDNSAAGQGIFRTGGDPWLKIPVHLPTGALVTEVELNYCDTGGEQFAAFWFRQAKNAPESVTPLLNSSGTPGCVVETATFATPQTIDNDANSYNIELALGATNDTIMFLSARVGYNLQISPAPAVATFADVPTGHPFFQHIEALAASGVTSGCGGGNFCPNQPLTRGQIAVFLASAFGLHWPN